MRSRTILPGVFRSAGDAEDFRVEQPPERRVVVAEFLRHHRLRGRASSVRNTRDIRRLVAAGRKPAPRAALPWSLIGLAAGVENAARSRFQPDRGRLGPSTIVALDVFDVSVGLMPRAADTCATAALMPAGGFGPGQKWSRLRHASRMHVLEGDVGSARHRGIERAARGAIGIARGSSSTARLARSIISFWSRSSSTANRAGTLASNGNCCSRRVQSAWMVCTLRPPGVSSAQANSSRAAIAQAGSGRAMPASTIAASSASSSSVTQCPRSRTPAPPCWRRRPW